MPVSNYRRREILKRDGHTCQNCGLTGKKIHHIKKESAGGSDDSDNLVTLCSGCHNTLHMLEGGQDVTPLSLLDALPDPTDIRGLDTPLAVAVFRHLKDGRDEDEPWGYTSASRRVQPFGDPMLDPPCLLRILYPGARHVESLHRRCLTSQPQLHGPVQRRALLDRGDDLEAYPV